MHITITTELESRITTSIEAGNFNEVTFLDFNLNGPENNVKIRVSKTETDLIPIKTIEHKDTTYFVGIPK
ncbi:MAG: hypothetical protein H6779_04460 [Candidatus Nomurabacteria bacterium]|nr:MAG: hypothetical protein H6779_04460 [Candidatus Nomurabacteria bacterium]